MKMGKDDFDQLNELDEQQFNGDKKIELYAEDRTDEEILVEMLERNNKSTSKL